MNTKPFGVSLQIAKVLDYICGGVSVLLSAVIESNFEALLTVLLAIWHIVWPITRVYGIVVEK